jgi:hypothetical protein
LNTASSSPNFGSITNQNECNQCKSKSVETCLRRYLTMLLAMDCGGGRQVG